MSTYSQRGTSSEGEVKQVPLRVDPVVYNAIKDAATKSNQSVNSVINGILTSWVMDNSSPLGAPDPLATSTSAVITSSIQGASTQNYGVRQYQAAGSAQNAAYSLRAVHTPGHPYHQAAVDKLAGKKEH